MVTIFVKPVKKKYEKPIGGGGNTAMGGNTMIVYSSNITFNENGQFLMKKTGGGSNTDFNVNTSAYSNSNAAGTYKLNGYSIEMGYNNGQVVRKLFYFYPDSRTTFGIGDHAYVPDCVSCDLFFISLKICFAFFLMVMSSFGEASFCKASRKFLTSSMYLRSSSSRYSFKRLSILHDLVSQRKKQISYPVPALMVMW
ncbi:hypothetical protein [Longitalea arenae]|uniref:hypothetical protein n=1 Tax=Longitalea arenae TaxID=2812558 RepID=UPI00196860C7|nr:hypothetical protein [Longitalea arenae]